MITVHNIVSANSDGLNGKIVTTTAMATLMQFSIQYEKLTLEPHVLNIMEAAEQSHVATAYL